MNISFANEEIRDLCNVKELMDKRFSKLATDILRRRLIQLSAANALDEFSPEGSPPVKCQVLDERLEKFRVPVHQELHLFFSNLSGIKKVDSSNWSNIREIRIDNIEEVA